MIRVLSLEEMFNLPKYNEKIEEILKNKQKKPGLSLREEDITEIFGVALDAYQRLKEDMKGGQLDQIRGEGWREEPGFNINFESFKEKVNNIKNAFKEVQAVERELLEVWQINRQHQLHRSAHRKGLTL